MCQGQFDLEDQFQSHQFSNSSETFVWSIHGSSLKIKFKTPQYLSGSQGITEMMTQTTTEPKAICLPLVGWEIYFLRITALLIWLMVLSQILRWYGSLLPIFLRDSLSCWELSIHYCLLCESSSGYLWARPIYPENNVFGFGYKQGRFKTSKKGTL